MSKAPKAKSNVPGKLEALIPLRKEVSACNIELSFLLDRYHILHSDSVDELSAIGYVADKCRAFEKMSCIQVTFDKLELGVLETDIIKDLCSYLNLVQCERVRTQLQLDRINDENDWLRKEFRSLNDKLNKINHDVKNLENERQQYVFIHQIRQGTDNINDVSHNAIVKEFEIDTLFEAAVSAKMKSIYGLVVPYLNQGRYEVVTAMLQRLANDENEKDLTTLDRGLLNFLQGVNLSFQNKPKDALVFLAEAVASVQAKYSSEHPILNGILQESSHCLIKLNQPSKAVLKLKQIVEIKTKHSGPKHEETLKAIVDLAEIQLLSGNFEEVVTAMTEILGTLRKLLSDTDVVVIRASNCLADAKLNLNRIDESIEIMHDLFSKVFLRPDTPEITNVIILDAASPDLADKLKRFYLPLEGSEELACIKTLHKIYTAKKSKAAPALLELIDNANM